MGEPAGIGGELALKTWLRRGSGVPGFFLIDDPARLSALAGRLGLPVPVATIDDPGQTHRAFAESLPVLAEPLTVPVTPGHPEIGNAACVRRSIERAVHLVAAGEASAVVTNPIHKHVMQSGGFAFPGHTEFLAHLAGPQATSVMLLAGPQLRVVPVTIHMSLVDAAGALSEDLIVRTCQVVCDGLRRDFGIRQPRLAVTGLNPHAGEGGAFGDEEIRIITPAIDRLRAMGLAVSGPHAADSLFEGRSRAGYDVAICMYHDQALIPVKTLDFERTVNVTLGLPFVRTSPDHGTALDIAGTGQASEESLVAALRLAADMARNRIAPLVST